MRKSNIELLRIICIICVIIQHFCENSAVGGLYYASMGGTINHVVLQFFYAFARSAVNIFIIICGYFSVNNNKRNLSKPVVLYMKMIVYAIISYSVISIYFKTFSLRMLLGYLIIPQNYYIMLYLTLYFISPFINSLISTMDEQTYKKLLIVNLVMFGIYSSLINSVLGLLGKTDVVGAYTVSLTGTQRGFSIVSFVFMYLIGGYIKKYGFDLSFKCKSYLILVNTLILSIVSIILPTISGALLNYDSMLVIANAVLIFSIFERFTISNNIVNILAKQSLGVFLIHYSILTIITSKIGMEYCSSAVFVMLFYFILVVTTTYLSSLIFSAFLEKMFTVIEKNINKFEILKRDIFQ